MVDLPFFFIAQDLVRFINVQETLVVLRIRGFIGVVLLRELIIRLAHLLLGGGSLNL